MDGENIRDKLRDSFYAYAKMTVEDQLGGGDTFHISKKNFNEYIEKAVKGIDAGVREARIEAWISLTKGNLMYVRDSGNDITEEVLKHDLKHYKKLLIQLTNQTNKIR